MSKKISDAEFNAAFNDPENKATMKSCSGRFFKSLSEDERGRCEMMALWYSLQKHDETFNQKFTTTLWTFVEKKCLNAIKENRARKVTMLTPIGSMDFPRNPDDEDPAPAIEQLEDIKRNLRFILPEERTILREHYIEGFTLEEIARIHGWSKEASRQKVSSAQARMKELCAESHQGTLQLAV